MIVEIDEVAARVIRSYWGLLLAMLVVPALLAGFAASGQEPVHIAKTRLQASSKATDAAPGDAGVSIVVSQVKAFATSRNLLDRVLKAQGVDREPAKMAKQISVAGLGTSTVVEMAVKDPDPEVARKLSDALGAAVVGEINQSNQGALLGQIKELDKRIKDLTKKLAPLSRKAGSIPTPDIEAANERERVSSELTDLRADRSELRGQLAQSGTASVVQPAVLEPPRDGTLLMTMVAGLVGLVGGILIAVVLETFRPTVPGQQRVARRLGVPLLGHAEAGPGELRELGQRIRLAAKRAGVTRVTLVIAGPGPVSLDLISTIAAAVYGDDTKVVRATPPTPTPKPEPGNGSGEDNGNGNGGEPSSSVVKAASGTAVLTKRSTDVATTGANKIAATGGGAAARANCQVTAFADIDAGADDQVGVVTVAGPVTRAEALDSVRDLIAASGWPLLGVVAVKRKTKG